MSRATRPMIQILVGFILMPLLSGCVYLQSTEPAPGVTVTITLDAFDPKLRLSEQILALNARTGDAFVMESPERPRWGRPLEGKLYPNGIYRATYGPLPPGSDVNDWVFVLANEDCSISRITRAPFDRVGSAGTPRMLRRSEAEPRQALVNISRTR